MRIAYFSDNFFPEITGIADSIITTGEELKARGHEILYVAPRYSEHDYGVVDFADKDKSAIHRERKNLRTFRLSSMPMKGSPTGQSRIVIPFGQSIFYLKEFKPHILHTQSPFGTGLEALWASRRLKIPLVGTNHTPIEEFIGYVRVAGNLPALMARRFFAWYYNRCEFVTAPYQGLIDDMRAVGFKKNARALPNPIPTNVFRLASGEEKATAKKRRDLQGSVILYSGRLAPEKHIDVIIRAVANISAKHPVTFVVTGHGVAEEYLRALARELHIEEAVRFTGFVGFERLAEFYRAADIFAILSTAETQSLALMQAYASGLPAIAARARGLVHYVPEGVGFLVEPGNVEELSEKLVALLADAKLREQMGKSGHAFVSQCSPRMIADAWERIYKEHARP